mgnify:CR=1 FL=1
MATTHNTEKVGLTWSIKAVTAAISGQRFAKPDGAAASSGGNALGVTLYEITSGDDMAVAIEGIVRIETVGAVAVNDEIQAGDGAKAFPLISGKVKLGTAVTAASAAGEIILIKL